MPFTCNQLSILKGTGFCLYFFCSHLCLVLPSYQLEINSCFLSTAADKLMSGAVELIEWDPNLTLQRQRSLILHENGPINACCECFDVVFETCTVLGQANQIPGAREFFPYTLCNLKFVLDLWSTFKPSVSMSKNDVLINYENLHKDQKWYFLSCNLNLELIWIIICLPMPQSRSKSRPSPEKKNNVKKKISR